MPHIILHHVGSHAGFGGMGGMMPLQQMQGALPQAVAPPDATKINEGFYLGTRMGTQFKLEVRAVPNESTKFTMKITY